MKDQIERHLSSILEQWQGPPLLLEAARAALLAPAKRVRPLLVCQIARALGTQDVSMAAIAVELFHTASLIADDLPCMDNAVERRGRPAIHLQYGEATAILVTYGLISAGYQALQKGAESLNERRLSLALEIASRTTGFRGAVSGQYWDLFPPDQPSMDHLEEVASLKTGTFFELAFSLGWLFGGGDLGTLPRIQSAGLHYGIAFQLQDDLQDAMSDRPGQSSVLLTGRKATEQRIKSHINTCHQQLLATGVPLLSLDSLISGLAPV